MRPTAVFLLSFLCLFYLIVTIFIDKISYEPIGAVVVTGNDDKFKKKTLKRDEVVLRPHYAPRRDLSFEFTANPGKSYIFFITFINFNLQIFIYLFIYTNDSL